jgi:hypothetical protein
MSAPDATPFTPDAVAAICRHMNDDHPDDCVRMVRGLAGVDADRVTMTGLDADRAYFHVESPEAVDVSLAWSEHLTERGQVRVEVVRMHEEACRKLGIDLPAVEGH